MNNNCLKCGKPIYTSHSCDEEDYIIAPSIQNFIEQGWQCPACHTIYSPYIRECTCQKRSETLYHEDK